MAGRASVRFILPSESNHSKLPGPVLPPVCVPASDTSPSGRGGNWLFIGRKRGVSELVSVPPRLAHSSLGHNRLQGLSMSPEEEEELRRVEKWVEMMAEMDTEEEAMMQAWMRPRSGSS